MMQPQHYSQQQPIQTYPQQQRPASSSPIQRQLPTPPFTPPQNGAFRQFDQEFLRNHSDPRTKQLYTQQYSQEALYAKVQALERENQSLKQTLENANNQIAILTQKLNEQPTSTLLKTTTFELVVLQKAVEQLQGIKQGLQKKKNQLSNNQTTLPNSQKEVFSEVNNKFEQKQEIPFADQLFPKKDLKLEKNQQNVSLQREGRKLAAQSGEIRPSQSPMKYVNGRAGANKSALRVSPHSQNKSQQL